MVTMRCVEARSRHQLNALVVVLMAWPTSGLSQPCGGRFYSLFMNALLEMGGRRLSRDILPRDL
jgi:hypothetical protein